MGVESARIEVRSVDRPVSPRSVRTSREPCSLPTYEPAPAGPQSDVPGKARLSGHRAAGSTRCPSSTASRRSRWSAPGTAVYTRERLSSGDDPARARRTHPLPRSTRRTATTSSTATRHQAGPGRPRRAVDLRRHRVQLAAAPPARAPSCRSTSHIEEHDDGACTVWLERARPDEPHEGHARRPPASRTGRSSS